MFTKLKILNLKIGNMQIYTNAKTMNYELHKTFRTCDYECVHVSISLNYWKVKGSLCPQGMCSI